MSNKLPETAEHFDVKKYNTGMYDLYFRNGEKCNYYPELDQCYPRGYCVKWYNFENSYMTTSTMNGLFYRGQEHRYDIFIVPKQAIPNDLLLAYNTLL